MMIQFIKTTCFAKFCLVNQQTKYKKRFLRFLAIISILDGHLPHNSNPKHKFLSPNNPIHSLVGAYMWPKLNGASHDFPHLRFLYLVNCSHDPITLFSFHHSLFGSHGIIIDLRLDISIKARY